MDPAKSTAQHRSLIRALCDAYGRALIDGDAGQAELVVRDAIDVGLSAETIADEVIAPSMRRVGDLWADGALSVADEHLATQITVRILVLQREAFRVARRRARDRIMLAGMEGEHHVVGLQMAGDLLAHAGYEVRLLGPDVPIDSLAAIVRKHSPRVFALTATMPDPGALVPLAVDELRRANPHVAVVVGGSGVPRGLHGADWLVTARSVAGFVEVVDSLVRRPTLN
jgi:methanogenic corrinoid protein MtbC1